MGGRADAFSLYSKKVAEILFSRIIQTQRTPDPFPQCHQLMGDFKRQGSPAIIGQNLLFRSTLPKS